MKKLIACLMTTLLLLTLIPIHAQLKEETETVSSPVAVVKPVESPQIKILCDRLNEINAMDKSKLTSVEKKELRKEVRSMKKQLGEDSKFIEGMYITFTAALVVFCSSLLVRND